MRLTLTITNLKLVETRSGAAYRFTLHEHLEGGEVYETTTNGCLFGVSRECPWCLPPRSGRWCNIYWSDTKQQLILKHLRELGLLEGLGKLDTQLPGEARTITIQVPETSTLELAS